MTPRNAYYNEIDPWAAALLRNLIKAGHIAPGDVDTRSIEDVKPDDLRPYKQCHFFAGAGVWSAALRRAGWPDDRGIWTGSAPCQPFSAAGAGAGFDDKRHLWPALHHLVQQCRPKRIYGEQVASKAVDAWLDLVQADMEGLGYAFGACAFPSAGVGAPHIRDRTYWMADAGQYDGHTQSSTADYGQSQADRSANIIGGRGVSLIRLGHPDDQGSQGHAGHDGAAGRGRSAGSIAEAGLSGGMGDAHGKPAGRDAGGPYATEAEHGAQHGNYFGLGDASDSVSGVADADSQPSRQGRAIDGGRDTGGDAQSWSGLSSCGHTGIRPGPTNGQWRDADWLLCRDGKWRAVEPGTFPLAHGAPARVGRLRAYGNACNLEAAYEFIMATRDY